MIDYELKSENDTIIAYGRTFVVPRVNDILCTNNCIVKIIKVIYETEEYPDNYNILNENITKVTLIGEYE